MKVVIIGNGIAGTNAARFIRKNSDDSITMISEESLSPFSRTALMYIYMGHVKEEHTHLYEEDFWKRNRIERIQDKVVSIDITNSKVHLEKKDSITFDKLILATGSKPNFFNWKGQELNGVQGLYHLKDLKTLNEITPNLKKAVVVGGGLIGVELVEMLLSKGIHVSFLVREPSFWNMVLPPEESEMVNREIRRHHVDVHFNTELKEIIGDDSNSVTSILTNSNLKFDCEFVGITVGVSPNIEFLRDSGILTNRGILVNEYLETNVKNIFAIGDCAELIKPSNDRRPIEAVWYTGRMMGQTVASTITNVPTKYEPKLWFNSAKFFDIEYQVYGTILNTIPDDVFSLYWEHRDGTKAIRINYKKDTCAVIGFNLMGIRYRHEVCEKWILEGTHVENVLSELKLANFDPEFFPIYESFLLEKYEGLTGKKIKDRSNRSLSLVQKFFKEI
jgi:NAD(P)H-nitrite reductase large subunit